MPESEAAIDGSFPIGFTIATNLIWLVQIALAIHVYRTGRPYWWFWVLFAAPFLGGLAYFVFEIVPSYRHPRGLFYGLKPRKWRIVDLRRLVEESDTVTNRLSLADELTKSGQIEEAHEIASACLRGVFRDDPHTLTTVARCKLALGLFAEASELLDRVESGNDRILEAHIQVMKGDAYVGLTRYEEAEAAYEWSLGRYVGEAPRAGLATVYLKTGRLREAKRIWEDIRTKFRKANPSWRRTEKKWYAHASLMLKAEKG